MQLRDPNRLRRGHVEDVGFGGSCGVPPCDHWHLHAVVRKSVASEITITIRGLPLRSVYVYPARACAGRRIAAAGVHP